MKWTKQELDVITGEILACSINVHRELGPGLLESVYETCLCRELLDQNLMIKNQVVLPIVYKGEELMKDFRIDIVVEDEVIVEVKALDTILPVHEAQILTYLKLSEKRIGLLINFNVPLLKDGFRRFINGY